MAIHPSINKMIHLLLFSLTLSIAALPLNSPLLTSYDYIIIGGGPAGLTIANRLTENPNTTVLLLEAGPPAAMSPEVEIPGYIGDDIGGIYDWNLSTVPQLYLDGQPRSIPQGRALGGSTILNGMLWSRGGQGDYEDWVALGNPGWSWSGLLPYFMRSETFTPVASPAMAGRFGIEAYPPVHGFSGPVNVSYPNYFWNESAVLFDALNDAGIPTAYDPNTGLVAGASFLPLDLNPGSEERCTAAMAYYQPYAGRENFWVSTGLLVTQILFQGAPSNSNASNATPGDTSSGEGGSPGIPGGIFGALTGSSPPTAFSASPSKRSVLHQLLRFFRRMLVKRQTTSTTLGSPSTSSLVAIGVEFAPDAQSPRQTVAATQEVIVAAGALHSPQLLMLSGIGPAANLEALDIPINLDLPGVGSNLQDHGRVWAWYPYNNASFPNPTELTSNTTFASEALLEYYTTRTGPLTAAAVDGVAFPSLPYITNGSTSIPSNASSQLPNQYLPATTDPTVLAGYTLQLPLLINALEDITRAAYELLNANDGVLTVGNMRPFSRGTVSLQSSDPFVPPLIDPRYGSNPIDIQILQAALAFNTRLLSTSAMAELEPIQIFPPPDATEEEVQQYIDVKWQTEYHPAGTCAMMPLQLGGVVSPEMLVYGTRNLRVVDSSILPMLPAGHLQAVVYGVAEKAADIIKAAQSSNSRAGVRAGSTPATSSSTSSQATATSSTIPPTKQSVPSPITTSNSSGNAAFATTTTFVTVIYTQTVYAG